MVTMNLSAPERSTKPPYIRNHRLSTARVILPAMGPSVRRMSSGSPSPRCRWDMKLLIKYSHARRSGTAAAAHSQLARPAMMTLCDGKRRRAGESMMTVPRASCCRRLNLLSEFISVPPLKIPHVVGVR